jgi:hypothetical protein
MAGFDDLLGRIDGCSEPETAPFLARLFHADSPAKNTDTVPGKFPRRTPPTTSSAPLPKVQAVTEEQRRAIYTALKGQPAGPAFNADIGAELPSSVELRPMPDDVVARVQQTKDYRYAVADNRVLLVSPVTRYVVGIFVDDVLAPKAGEGRRTP